MTAPHVQTNQYDDPRRLRELIDKARELATEHALSSVVVGLAGFEGDVDFPGVVDFVHSALRVDDAVFRMTRERAVVLLTDVTEEGATEIIERLMNDYREHFPSTSGPAVGIGYFEVAPGNTAVSVKLVLPHIFAASPPSH
jgi:hypothetical protein